MDESFLNTGMGSPRLDVKTERKAEDEAKKAKIANRNNLLPSADVVLALIAKEKAHVKSIEEFDAETIRDDANFRTELLARKYYYDYLVTLERTVKNILREKTKPRRKEAEQ